MAADATSSCGGMHALDLASEAVWALVWERLGADKAAKCALAATSRALHDLALGSWTDIRLEVTYIYAAAPAAFDAAAAAVFVNRLRSPSLTLTCSGKRRNIAALGTVLAALEGGAAARVAALAVAGNPCGGHLQQLSPFTSLHTLVWSVSSDSDPADLATGLAALPPSLTSLHLAVDSSGSAASDEGSAARLTAAAALHAIGAAAVAGGLARLQRLTGRHGFVASAGELTTLCWSDDADWLRETGLAQLAALPALRELALPSVCGIFNAERLQPLQALGQVPLLEVLRLEGGRFTPTGLAALARVRPWAGLELRGLCDEHEARGEDEEWDEDEGEDVYDDWTLPALRTLDFRSPSAIPLNRMMVLAERSPVLAEVLCRGAPANVLLDMPPEATAAQAADELSCLQFLHERHLLRGLEVFGRSWDPPPLPPVAVLSKAAALAGPLALPEVGVLVVKAWDVAAGGFFTDQHLSWLLGVLPNVRRLKLRSCGLLTGGGALAALQRMQQEEQQRKQAPPGGRERPLRFKLTGDLPGISWADVCAWAAALPAGQHAPLEIVVKARLADVEPVQQAGTTLTHTLRLAGRGYATVRCAEAARAELNGVMYFY